MSFMAWIIQRLNDVSAEFYNLYLQVYSWPWPFWYAAEPFYWISSGFARLAWDFSDFSNWLDYLNYRISKFLDWPAIWSMVLGYIPNLSQIRDWFYNWYQNILAVVKVWWSYTVNDVLGWIAAARSELELIINQLNAALVAFTAVWDAFKAKIPTLDEVIAWWSNWTVHLQVMIDTWWSSALRDVQGLIDSAFLARAGFWAGWQDWRVLVAEFFADPLTWLEGKFTTWFLGAE